MEESLKSFVILVYDQCKNENCSLVDVNKIIHYITSNFTLNDEEATQLKISNLFNLLREEGKYNADLISEDQFERVLQLWIPLVQYDDRSYIHQRDDDLVSAEGIHQRLSRSLTNLKQMVDEDNCHNLRLCQSWICDNPANDENTYGDLLDESETYGNKSGSMSPHEDPFTIPIHVIKSTPTKSLFTNIGGLQQPNLRYIKLNYNASPSYFSDSDALLRHDSSLIDENSSENVGSNKDVNIIQPRRKRYRRNMMADEDTDNDDQRDLLSQLKQIKFKNSQLVEINDRLQTQLESFDENLRNLSNKCWNLEKKTKLYNIICEENKQFVSDVDDLRKSLDKEIEAKKSLFTEKVMMECEIVVSKEHIKSLVEKLSLLDAGLEEKDIMISSLRTMISHQQDFSDKLQELNLEKDEEIIKNKNNMNELTEIVKIYEGQIQTLVREKKVFEINGKAAKVKDTMDYVDKVEYDQHRSYQDQGCAAGCDDDSLNMFTTNAQFMTGSVGSPWSIKVEMARHLVDSRGDNPLCEKMIIDDEWITNEDSDDNSFHMLKELLSVLSSLRMTLTQYKDQLESASLSIKTNEHFLDEISLSYVSHLDESIHLLSSSTEKAARCQNQFNETFEFLMKRISNLKNEKRALILKNEQLLLQVNQSSLDIVVAEKMSFLQEELRKERLLGLKKENEMQTLEKFRERWKDARCSNCGRCTDKFSVNSEMNKRQLATEALNLERDSWNIQRRRIDFRRSFSNIERDIVYNSHDSWLKGNGALSRKSSNSVDRLLDQNCQEEDTLRIRDNELNDERNYYISTDDLSSTLRYKLSKVHNAGVDIDKIIENSWLDTHSTTIEERRASVFAQFSDGTLIVDNTATDIPLPNDSIYDVGKSPEKCKKRSLKRSSSCSSSNDTSDANSIDVTLERRKLAQELEGRFNRMQTRSPVPSTLSVTDDLKSVTPTVNEDEQIKEWQTSLEFTEVDVDIYKFDSRNNFLNSVVDECCATESVSMDIPLSTFRSSCGQTSLDNVSAVPFDQDSVSMKPVLPTISIIEASSDDTSEILYQNKTEPNLNDDTKSNVNLKKVMRGITVESESNSLQASMNRSSISSRNSSVHEDDSKLCQRSRQGNKRVRRPNTVTGIGLINSKIVQSDSSSNFEDHSTAGDIADIQESIDLLQEAKKSLTNISSEDLENKFNEVTLFYKTDRPSVVDRAHDVSKKCSKALNNVEQEFNVLRHLIKSVAQVLDQPCDFVPRIKASISFLEKCVEYLSAKSEILGAIEQEVKMSSIIDVINEYNNMLTKQREVHLRELEEMRESNMEMCANGSFDQSRTKRSVLAGKDPKSRFQILAQNTVMKSSIIRQLTGKPGQLSSLSDSIEDLDHAGFKSSYKRSGNQPLESLDSSKRPLDMDSTKLKRFFPGTDESGESLFQKGLQQGLRMKTDEALLEIRAEQSRFSTTLDSLSDIIDEYEPLQEEGFLHSPNIDRKIVAIKQKFRTFFANFKIAFTKSTYALVGFVVVIALLIPWLLTPTNPQSSSFSIPVSRRRIHSAAEIDDKSSSSRSSSPFFPNVNVIRHRPAAV